MTIALIVIAVLVLSVPVGIFVGKCLRGPLPRSERRNRP